TPPGREMQPLVISPFSIVNSLGRGTEPILRALREKRSGLAPCGFETARIDTYVGPVPELDDFRVRPDLHDYDCRNNRLAQLCLEQDGFAKEIAAARDRYGAGRIGWYLGTSTPGRHTTELAYRRRDPKTGALPADYRQAQTT